MALRINTKAIGRMAKRMAVGLTHGKMGENTMVNSKTTKWSNFGDVF
jgi:hypothetical protein